MYHYCILIISFFDLFPFFLFFHAFFFSSVIKYVLVAFIFHFIFCFHPFFFFFFFTFLLLRILNILFQPSWFFYFSSFLSFLSLFLHLLFCFLCFFKIFSSSVNLTSTFDYLFPFLSFFLSFFLLLDSSCGIVVNVLCCNILVRKSSNFNHDINFTFELKLLGKILPPPKFHQL